MKTTKFDSNEQWMAARLGKITGSRLKDIVVKRGTGKKIGYYELIAERLGVPADDEKPMDRGHRLENEAMERFSKETGQKVDMSLIMWTRDDNESIAISPDGVIGKTEAVEVKCLSSARHMEAYLTREVPDEYQMQGIQYFICNDKLKKLHFVFYDPRFLVEKVVYFTIEITRDQVAKEIEEYLAYERNVIMEIDRIVNQLTF